MPLFFYTQKSTWTEIIPSKHILSFSHTSDFCTLMFIILSHFFEKEDFLEAIFFTKPVSADKLLTAFAEDLVPTAAVRDI